MKSQVPFGLSLSEPFDKLSANGLYFTELQHSTSYAHTCAAICLKDVPHEPNWP